MRLAEGLVEVDTAGWAKVRKNLVAESKKVLKRLPKKWKNKVGERLGCQPRMTIGTMVYLINGMHPHGLDNGV